MSLAARLGGGTVFRRLSIRNKLLVLVLLPLAVVLPLLGLLLLAWGSEAFDRMLVTKVRSDLAVANGYFERALGEVGASVAAVAESHALHRALAAPATEQAALLERYRVRERLDFVNLRAADAGLLVTHASWHWIFLINVPIGILGVILVNRFLPDWQRVANRPMDFVGHPAARRVDVVPVRAL